MEEKIEKGREGREDRKGREGREDRKGKGRKRR